MMLVVWCATLSGATTPSSDALAAWDSYLAKVEGSISPSPTPFLLLGKEPSQRDEARSGKVIITQIKRKPPVVVPHALIHDWAGLIFIPKVTLADVFTVTRNYAAYPKWYAPTIIRGRLLAMQGNEGDRFLVRYFRRVLFVTTILEVEYDARYCQLDSTHWYSTARSVRMQEIDQSDKTVSRTTPVDDGGGYVWRIYTLTRFEQKDQGVYLEQESIALSRPIPASLHWIVEPVVRRLSRDLLQKSLEQTRNAVLSNSGK
jgi:hypothetical protein